MAKKRGTQKREPRMGWMAVSPIRKTNHSDPSKSIIPIGSEVTGMTKRQLTHLQKHGAIEWVDLDAHLDVAEDRTKSAPAASRTERGVAMVDHDKPVETGREEPTTTDPGVDVEEMRDALSNLSRERLETLATEKGLALPDGITKGGIVDLLTGREPEDEDELSPVEVLKGLELADMDSAAVYGLARKVDLPGRDDMSIDDLRAALKEIQDSE